MGSRMRQGEVGQGEAEVVKRRVENREVAKSSTGEVQRCEVARPRGPLAALPQRVTIQNSCPAAQLPQQTVLQQREFPAQ